ncbi:hypothetical protein [Brevundimonas sp.]|uniref:hypothetical protein n=1 Tax=Brevundimonas sp. TaxID=1871086 RepID=UPI0028AE8B39|nr:hypothetical protein [Brevundimonas sp.]
MGEKQGHTPGPWVVTSDGHYVSPGADLSKIVALIFRPNTDQEGERHANARLIAAAPDLLAALIEARDALHQHYVDWDGEPEDAVPLQLARSKCDAAISRATGEDSPANEGEV